MRIKGRVRQRGVELPLVISDHADWPELLDTIVETGAEEVWVTHGRDDALVLPARPHGPQSARAGARRLRGRGRVRCSVRRPARPPDDDPSRNGKLGLLVEYFRSAPDPDRGFALAALTDGLFPRLPLRRALGELMAARSIRCSSSCRATTSATRRRRSRCCGPTGATSVPPPRLAEIVAALELAPRNNVAPSSATSSTGSTCPGAGRCSSSWAARRASASRRGSPRPRWRRWRPCASDIEEIWHALDAALCRSVRLAGGPRPAPDAGGSRCSAR